MDRMISGKIGFNGNLQEKHEALALELPREGAAQALLIEQQAGRIERQTATIDELTSILVGHVISRATAAGRQDILDELAHTRDARKLQAWLLELS